jgi:beta-glucosidase
MADEPLPLPPNFLLGVSTAAYQIEGAWNEDGKGESIWDRFVHTPGAIERGETGDKGNGHYRRWAEDLDLIRDAGLNAYRFSISWPRVVPEGIGAANEAGLAFYDRVIDGCLERGIEPWICLYHWDLPQALEERGGWPARDSVQWFADYARLVARRYGDRVKRWATFNEPSNPAVLGYATGIHAPGRKEMASAARALHHLNLAHVAAADVLHADVADAQVGIILALNAFTPSSDDPADVRAAEFADVVNHGSFTGPALHGRYPEMLGQVFPHFGEDAETIARVPATLDWLGVNYYGPFCIGVDPATGSPGPKPRPGVFTTAIGWEVDPNGMRDWLLKLKHLGKPIYVTENGFPLEAPDLEDGDRIRYLHDHMAAALQAQAEGVDLRGYFVWTLVDNFEWAIGWRTRFGLVSLDLETLERTPKRSYRWLSEVARTRRLSH